MFKLKKENEINFKIISTSRVIIDKDEFNRVKDWLNKKIVFLDRGIHTEIYSPNDSVKDAVAVTFFVDSSSIDEEEDTDNYNKEEEDSWKQMNKLVVDMICNCEFDKKGYLIVKSTKAKDYLNYIKDIYKGV